MGATMSKKMHEASSKMMEKTGRSYGRRDLGWYKSFKSIEK